MPNLILKLKISMITLLSLMMLFIGGCWDREELEDQAFVQTIGVDKGEENQLLITFRIAIPSKSGLGQAAGGGGGEGSLAAQASLLTTIIAPTLPSAITLASGYVDRDLNLMHTKAVIFGESFARDGLNPVLDILGRYREIRRNIFLGVAQGTAYEFLGNNEPDLELSYAKWWEGVRLMQAREAIHPGTLFHDFVEDISTAGKEGTMIYLAINKGAKENPIEEIQIPPSFTQGELGIKAGEIPRTGGNPIEYLGTAYFKGDKFKGVLNLTETRSLMLLNGTLKESLYTVPDSLQENNYIPLEIKLGSAPKVNIDIAGDKVHIKETLSMEGDLLSIQSHINYASDLSKQRLLEQVIADNIKNRTLSMLEKLQKEEVDIVGYGEYARKHFLTMAEWEAYQWEKKFKDAQIDLVVNFEIRRTGMRSEPTRIKAQ